ncbi:ROK family protein [Sanguibacter hominis ATCC BAA-789]|uniref:ROK family protein n=1 Tax=Sanguibacter hominis ATCC BAA-789 TaxID=1312740 RepID=A0A9X5FAZ6_9MICO|nr:ROK family protein [Sanguibacter hominis ATCC BAA-789]
MSTDALVALDVGGTSIRGELLRPVRDAGEVVDLEVLERVLADTPRAGAEPDGDAILDAIERVCRTLLDSATSHRVSVGAVGVAVPGVVDTAAGVVHLAGNLGWRDVPVAAELSARLGVPVEVHHDVACAGLAERTLGAGRGVRDLLAVFIGTGIAATLTVAGTPVEGGHHAGELGHVPVREPGRPCPCGQTGCLEVYASARAIGRAYAAATGRDDVTSRDVVAALGTDPAADVVWDDALDALAHALLGAITLLGTERIVLGGGLSLARDALVAPLRERLLARARVAVVPEIVTAGLGPRAGVVGAALATLD